MKASFLQKLILIISCALLFFSCKQENILDKKGEEIVKKDSVVVNFLGEYETVLFPKLGKLYLEKYFYDSKGRMTSYISHIGSDGFPYEFVYKFNYNEEGYLITSEVSQYTFDDIYNGPEKKEFKYATTYYFEYNNAKKITSIYTLSKTGVKIIYHEFGYNSDNSLKSIKQYFYSSGVPFGTYVYEYKAGVLTKCQKGGMDFILNKDGFITKGGEGELFYDEKKRLIRYKDKNVEYTYTYDDKKNPLQYLYQFKGFPKEQLNIYPVRFYRPNDDGSTGLNLNNVLTVEFNGNINIKNEYEYDSYGFPVKATKTEGKSTSTVLNSFMVIK